MSSPTNSATPGLVARPPASSRPVTLRAIALALLQVLVVLLVIFAGVVVALREQQACATGALRGCGPCNPWTIPGAGVWTVTGDQNLSGKLVVDTVQARTAAGNVVIKDSAGNNLATFRDDGTTGTIIASGDIQAGAGHVYSVVSGDAYISPGPQVSAALHLRASSSGGTQQDEFIVSDPNTLTAQQAAASTIQGASNQDVTIKQQGTSKAIIHFATGDGAGVNADRLVIDSDKVKIANSPASVGTLVGNDSGALLLQANASGGGAVRLLSGGTMTINGGSAISNVLNGSASMTPAAVAAASCGNYGTTITVTGAAAGAACFEGAPSGGAGTNLTETCYVSALNTVSIRACNPSAASQTPTSGTRNVWVIQ